MKETQNFVYLATVTGREFIDSTTTIVTGGEHPNETIAQYKVSAVLLNDGQQSESSFSNMIEYNRVQGSYPEKRVAGPLGEIFEYNLWTNYPNPYNPETIIKYSIADQTDVKLAVYDILGREIKVLVNEKKEPGSYEVSFNAENLSSGIYIYRIQTPDFTKSQKMILVR